MKLELTREELENDVTKLLGALVSSDDVTNFSFDKTSESIQILIGDWCLELKEDGTWSVN